MSVSSRRDSSPSSARDYREVSSSSRRWRRRRCSQRPRLSSFDSMWAATSPRSGVSATDSSRCSRTSSATRSSSRPPEARITVGAASNDQEVVFWVADGGVRDRARGPALMSLTDSGKRREVTVEAPDSDFPSPRASSKLTGATSGSRAPSGGAARSSSRSRAPARPRISRPEYPHSATERANRGAGRRPGQTHDSWKRSISVQTGTRLERSGEWARVERLIALARSALRSRAHA